MPSLFDQWPALAETVPYLQLGRWPSPLEKKVVRGHALWFKREDLSADGYAGNKIRPLEMVLGAARARGLAEIWSTGAYGSNHALAAAVHAQRQGFFAGAILWPQPWSQTAEDNLVATASVADAVTWAGSVAAMPPLALWTRARRPAWVMPPGAATPLGAMGHASAALELGRQLAAASATIDTIVLPVGSTCTTAGLLVGTSLAHATGLWPGPPPKIVAVRVTPWPVTATFRIVDLAVATADRLVRELDTIGVRWLPGFARTAAAYAARLEVIGGELGPGYGEPTPSAWAMLAELSHVGVRLDTTYSAKAAAHLMARAARAQREPRERRERLLFWATKSALPLPPKDDAKLAHVPRRVHGWLRGAR